MSDKLIETIRLLKDSKAKKRESGAKRLRKLGAEEAGSALLSALIKDKRARLNLFLAVEIIFELGR